MPSPSGPTCANVRVLGTSHVHFRGRHLHGTTVGVPEGYTGVVLRTSDKALPRAAKTGQGAGEAMDDEDENPVGDEEGLTEEVEEVKIAHRLGTFEELVVWGHGGTVGEGDEFVRGVEEWVGFAEGVHLENDSDEGEGMEGVTS